MVCHMLRVNNLERCSSGEKSGQFENSIAVGLKGFSKKMWVTQELSSLSQELTTLEL